MQQVNVGITLEYTVWTMDINFWDLLKIMLKCYSINIFKD